MTTSSLDERSSKSLTRPSILQSNASLQGMLDSQEIRYPPLPTLHEIAQKHLPKEIFKEKQMELNERKIILEKQALIEEKERLEREKKARFNEREFDFNGENNLDELIPPKFELWNQNNVTCKSTRGIMDTFKMKGFANLPLDFRAFFKIKEEEPPVSKDKSLYLNFKKNKQKYPHLYKFTRKVRMREVHEKIKSYHEIDCESILTISENSKRAEIFAKLYMKLNLEEALEKIKKEEEEVKQKLKEAEEAKKEAEEPQALANIPEDDLNIINEDEDDEDSESEDQGKEVNLENELDSLLDGKNAKEINEKIRELLNNKQISLNGISGDDLKRIMLINENFEEIIEYFNKRVMEHFEKENYEECVYLKGKKEEFVGSLRDYHDYESLLRTLIIYRLNNNI